MAVLMETVTRRSTLRYSEPFKTAYTTSDSLLPLIEAGQPRQEIHRSDGLSKRTLRSLFLKIPALGTRPVTSAKSHLGNQTHPRFARSRKSSGKNHPLQARIANLRVIP